MKKEELFEVFGNIPESYIMEARQTMTNQIRKPKKASPLKIFGAVAACFCVVLAGTLTYQHLQTPGNSTIAPPHPEQVQVANPLVEVNSLEEMQQLLQFQVPQLEKEVEAYIVIVDDDSYPTLGRIMYADGSIFNMEYGSGDVSGIYGGEEISQEDYHGVTIHYYQYQNDSGETVSYALWETGGFSYSLTGSAQLQAEVQSLIS